ncbi:MAG: hypothetical protein C0514_02850 [Candidatus Puniceispirillum sp.]|nr:hypothetical protein [Candidatus Puniceispirillum sp.]
MTKDLPMQKKTLLTLLFLSTPSLCFATEHSLEEIEQGLARALNTGDEQQVEFWLIQQGMASLYIAQTKQEDGARAHDDAEAERLTMEFLQREEDEHHARTASNTLNRLAHEIMDRERALSEEERLTRAFLENEAREHEAQEARALVHALQVRALFASPFSEEDRSLLASLNSTSSSYSDLNVHDFNRAVVAPNADALLALGKRILAPNESTPAATVFSSMRSVIDQDGDHSGAEAAIAKLEAHLSHTAVDEETGIHVPHLLSALWDVATRFPDHRFGVEGGSYAANNTQQMIVHISMPEGLATEGGCFPGYAGRFFRDYLLLLTLLSKM